MGKKRYLFFFVHPSKYYFFRGVINLLKAKGNFVDIVIVTKDCLAELVEQEGWEYINIFPEGRRIKGIPILFATLINFFKTLFRLYKYISGKKYDIFISDDVLPILGRLKRIKSFFFTDNELTTVPESSLLCMFAHKIIAPQSVDLGRFNKKTIKFQGYKECAYLSPNYFTPDIQVVRRFNPELAKYFLIRLVSMTASHDRGIDGINDIRLRALLSLLEKHGKVFISSERSLPDEFLEHRLDIQPYNILHALYYADLFIGDSGTMASEAALCGTPCIMYHDFIGRLGVMVEKEKIYDLMYGFKTNEYDKMLVKLEQLLGEPDAKQVWQKKRDDFFANIPDVNGVLFDWFA